MKHLFLLAAGLALLGCVAGPGASASRLPGGPSAIAPLVLALPGDVARFQNVQPATTDDLANVTVSEAAARATARADSTLWAGGEAYVGRLTGFAVTDRLVWILRYPGISVVGPDPGVGSPPPPFNVAFVFVDARSGALLGTTMATE